MILSKAVFGCCKTFSGKYIFFGNANFRKRKIFPCVWLHFKKFSGKYFLVFGKEEGKHISKKTQATTQKKIINDDRRSRSMKRSRSCLLREIAIDGAISRSVDCEIAYVGERGRSCGRRRERKIATTAREEDRDLRSRSTARSSDWICRRTGSGLWLVFFWICVFLLLFQTPENIFRKIF